LNFLLKNKKSCYLIITRLKILSDYLKSPKPPFQDIFSEAARLICKNPNASSSRARLREPASTSDKPLFSRARKICYLAC